MTFDSSLLQRPYKQCGIIWKCLSDGSTSLGFSYSINACFTSESIPSCLSKKSSACFEIKMYNWFRLLSPQGPLPRVHFLRELFKTLGRLAYIYSGNDLSCKSRFMDPSRAAIRHFRQLLLSSLISKRLLKAIQALKHFF